jgi:hypothetical protein
MTAKKWLPIIVGVVIFVVLVGAGLIAGLVYVVTRNVNVQQLSTSGGQEAFDAIAARFAGQRPFIEIPESGDAVVHHELETHDTGSVSTLCVCAWAPRSRKLVRVNLPFWVLRLGSHRSVELHAGESGALTLDVTADQIDRRGPGLVLNQSRPGGEHILVWTE